MSRRRPLPRRAAWAAALALVICAASASGSIASDPAPGGPAPAPPLPSEIQPPGSGTVALLEPGGVLSTVATVRGGVRSYDRPVTVFFEYGTTTAYGQESSRHQLPAATVGGGLGVIESLVGLEPSTTYHYRLVVVSDNGTFTSEDGAITTTPEAPVRGRTGGLLDVGRGDPLRVTCTGEPDNNCTGTVRLTVRRTIRRGHRRLQRVVLLGSGSFSFSTGPITGPAAVTPTSVSNNGLVPIRFTRAARRLLRQTAGPLVATATLTMERSQPSTHRVRLRLLRRVTH